MNTPHRPIWRIPVMWLVIGLPLASIVAGVGLVIIAVNSGGADTVTDKVDRVAQIQTTDLGPDQQAKQLGLSMVMRLDKGAVEVIPVTGQFDRKAALELKLLHPSQQQKDRMLTLPPSSMGWRQELPEFDGGHDWNLLLAPKDGQWRLKGRLPRKQQAARLAPSLGEKGGT